MRKAESCINCGEVREIAAHGLCFRCYRRQERAEERQLAGVGRNNPAIRDEHKKVLRGFTSLMSGLSDLRVQANHVRTIRQLIDPYLEPIAEILAPEPPEEGQLMVNDERDSEEPFTVHSLQDQPEKKEPTPNPVKEGEEQTGPEQKEDSVPLDEGCDSAAPTGRLIPYTLTRVVTPARTIKVNVVRGTPRNQIVTYRDVSGPQTVTSRESKQKTNRRPRKDERNE